MPWSSLQSLEQLGALCGGCVCQRWDYYIYICIMYWLMTLALIGSLMLLNCIDVHFCYTVGVHVISIFFIIINLSIVTRRDSGTDCALVGVSRQNFTVVYSVLWLLMSNKQVPSFLPWGRNPCRSFKGRCDIQVPGTTECMACRFHIYSLNCRYLQLICRYLQMNCRYLQIGLFVDISNWIEDISNWIVDISK